MPSFSNAEDGSLFTYISVGSAGSIIGYYGLYYGDNNTISLQTLDSSGTPIEFSDLFEWYNNTNRNKNI